MYLRNQLSSYNLENVFLTKVYLKLCTFILSKKKKKQKEIEKTRRRKKEKKKKYI